MWDLVSWPAIEPGPLAFGVQSLNHWTTREVLYKVFSLLPFTGENRLREVGGLTHGQQACKRQGQDLNPDPSISELIPGWPPASTRAKGNLRSHLKGKSRQAAWRRKHPSWALKEAVGFLKTELRRAFRRTQERVEVGEAGPCAGWGWRAGLCRALAATAGTGSRCSYPSLPLPPPVTFPDTHPPAPHLSQREGWKINESVYEAHNVASKTRHSAEQLGASNGILFMSFSSWRWSHYRPEWRSVTLHSPSDVPMSHWRM